MKRLLISETDKKFLGVCGGIAEYFGVDSTLIRAIFVVFAVVCGSGLLVYLLLAAIMPRVC